MKLIPVALLALVTSTSGALAQSSPTPPPPCSTAEYRQLDFWVGEWIATFDNGDGTKGTGKNRIDRKSVV